VFKNNLHDLVISKSFLLVNEYLNIFTVKPERLA